MTDEVLRTARLTLTPWTSADVDALWTMFRAPSVRRYLLDDRVVDREFVAELLAGSESRFAAGSLGLYCARAADGALAGIGGFLLTGEPPALELIYALDPAYTGRGLATELGLALVARYFARTDAEVLRASVDLPNAASIRVLERLGMRLLDEVPGPLHPLRRYTQTRAGAGAR